MPDDAIPEQKYAPDHQRAIGRTGPDKNQQAFARWLEGMFALSLEITEFTQRRLQEDVATWLTLATCHNPEQALDCQQRFIARTSDQYFAEISKLCRMMMTVASQGLSFTQQQSPPAPQPIPGSHPIAH
jgi:phasin protein